MLKSVEAEFGVVGKLKKEAPMRMYLVNMIMI